MVMEGLLYCMEYARHGWTKILKVIESLEPLFLVIWNSPVSHSRGPLQME
jgi:hypothetical protein